MTPVWLGAYPNSYELEVLELPNRGVRDGYELMDLACKIRTWGLDAYDLEAKQQRDRLRDEEWEQAVLRYKSRRVNS